MNYSITSSSNAFTNMVYQDIFITKIHLQLNNYVSAYKKQEVALDITWMYQIILWMLRYKSCDTLLFTIPMMVTTLTYAFANYYQIIITQQNTVVSTISGSLPCHTSPVSIDELTTESQTWHSIQCIYKQCGIFSLSFINCTN